MFQGSSPSPRQSSRVGRQEKTHVSDVDARAVFSVGSSDLWDGNWVRRMLDHLFFKRQSAVKRTAIFFPST